jgi:hypothetical protein
VIRASRDTPSGCVPHVAITHDTSRNSLFVRAALLPDRCTTDAGPPRDTCHPSRRQTRLNSPLTCAFSRGAGRTRTCDRRIMSLIQLSPSPAPREIERRLTSASPPQRIGRGPVVSRSVAGQMRGTSLLVPTGRRCLPCPMDAKSVTPPRWARRTSAAERPSAQVPISGAAGRHQNRPTAGARRRSWQRPRVLLPGLDTFPEEGGPPVREPAIYANTAAFSTNSIRSADYRVR